MGHGQGQFILLHLLQAIDNQEFIVTEEELVSVQKYMCEKFGNDQIKLRDRTQADESVEVYIGDEFIGIIYRDEEDGEVSYDFNMAILAFDVQGTEVANDDEPDKD